MEEIIKERVNEQYISYGKNIFLNDKNPMNRSE